MISATFGDELWSARGAGLGMIMQAIKVRRDLGLVNYGKEEHPNWVLALIIFFFVLLLLSLQVRQGNTVKIALEAPKGAKKAAAPSKPMFSSAPKKTVSPQAAAKVRW